MTVQTSPVANRPSNPAAGPVVAGVDGSLRGSPAALWAAAEAVSRSEPLRLVGACPLPNGLAAAGVGTEYPLEEIEDFVRTDLNGLAKQLRTAVRDVQVSVSAGDAGSVLLGAVEAERASLLVVGSRGLRGLRRAVSRSTSIAVAGRCPVGVVVVPDGWVQVGWASAPIMIAVKPGSADAATLDFGFERAARLRVPLVAVAVPAYGVAEEASESAGAWQMRWESTLWRTIAPWRARFPHVEVSIQVVEGKVVPAVLAASVTAQLLVVGRRSRLPQSLGFRLGPTVRGVLHGLTCPVAVVPVGHCSPPLRRRRSEDA